MQTLLVNAYFHAVFRLCARVKSGLIDMLYRKSLRISCGAREGFGPGVVNNLQSNDAAKLCVELPGGSSGQTRGVGLSWAECGATRSFVNCTHPVHAWKSIRSTPVPDSPRPGGSSRSMST